MLIWAGPQEPAQPDTLVLLAMIVKAAGYIMHAEYVLWRTVGTAYREAFSHFSDVCRRRMCYVDN